MVKLQRSNAGQYVITISKQLVEAKGYKAQDVFEWRFNKDGNLELIKRISK